MAGALALTSSSAAAETCLRVLRAGAAGSVAVAADFEAAPCEAAAARAFRYDRASGLARLSRALAGGEVVFAPAASALSAVRPGESLTLRTVVGPVAVERTVQVVGAGRARGRMSVRGADGEVFAVDVPEAAP